jgi:cathepsin B
MIVFFILVFLLLVCLYLLRRKESYVYIRFPYFLFKKGSYKTYPAKTSTNPFKIPLKEYPEAFSPPFFKYKEKFLTEVGNQGVCGSCWSFAIASTISDRVMIRTLGKFQKRLSPQAILSCINYPNGCDGAELDTACKQLAEQKIPLPSESTDPYEQHDNATIVSKCQMNINGIYIDPASVKSIVKFQAEIGYDQSIIDQNVKNMKYELIHHGPFFCAMTVYSDLYQYAGDRPYTKGDEATFVGGHAIEIVGYCDKGADPRDGFNEMGYWICRNSWGPDWPLKKPVYGNGYFMIRMGTNECGIESRCGCAEPILENESVGKDLSFLRYESFEEFVNDNR